MTQEDKELLLIDLCARLPYGVKCKYYDYCEGDYNEGTICGFERQEYIQIDGVCIHIEDIKPYLFPLSSITDEQMDEYDNLKQDIIDKLKDWKCAKLLDWLNKNHFDYRSLNPKGLAIDCTNLNIY